MIVAPYFRGGVSATAHPGGCARTVEEWIDRAGRAGPPGGGPRTLVVGSSGGVGLATRVAAAFGAGAPTVGVCLDRPPTERRTGTPGWYRVAALERAAQPAGLPSATVVGDAFADATKVATADAVRRVLGAVDLLVYSVAAPRRRDPRTGELHTAVIKSVGAPVRVKGYDAATHEIAVLDMPAATEADITGTVAVMGGADLEGWIGHLDRAGVLAPGVRCLALSYVGVSRLSETYRGATLGRAKQDMEARVRGLDRRLAERHGGRAGVVALRALITQASLAMPLTLLYTMLLERVLAERGELDDLLDQGGRLVAADPAAAVDDEGRIRFDEREQHPEVQAEVWRLWEAADTATVRTSGLAAVLERRRAQLYGFDVPGVDYAADVDPCPPAPGMRVL